MRFRSALIAALACALLAPAAAATAPASKPDGKKKEPCPGAKASLEKVGAKGVRTAIHCIVNFERTKRGLPKLKADKRLDAAAQAHSKDMAQKNYFDHYDQQGKDPGDRISDKGYRWSAYGENIFLGPDTALELMKGWMASSGHCRNILAPHFRDFGFGIAEGDGKVLSTQDFGTAQGDEPGSSDQGPSKGCPEKLRYPR